MADILRTVEFRELVGSSKRAELGPKRITWDAYIDTGAGRTVISERVAHSIRMPRTDMKIEYVVPIKKTTRTAMTAMRLVESGCQTFLPTLVAVSDKVIQALDLPGVEVLVGQDYLEAARVRIDLAPKGEKEKVACRVERARRVVDEELRMKVKGNHWYVTGPNVRMATGSLRVGDRPPSIGHIEVLEPRRGTGSCIVVKVLHAFRKAGEREFVTTPQTADGEKLFADMERKGLIQKMGGTRDEIRYRIL